MKRILLIVLLAFAATFVHGQSFSVDDLATLASLPSGNIDRYMNKKGFEVASSKTDSLTTDASFVIKLKANKPYIGPKRSIDISMKEDCKYFIFYTTSRSEYLDGKKSLAKAGFFFDSAKNVSSETAMLFQKGNIIVEVTPDSKAGVPGYTFTLKQKKIPSTVKYAEDLLQFNSHEFLASFFGEQNVEKDKYYFSEKELRRCSVLFSGTRYQVVFIWKDQDNLKDLLYIVVPHKLPTESAQKSATVTGSNEWQFRNGIYPGMNIKELLRLNERDFGIFGNKSDLAYMVDPIEEGKINFRKTVVVLSCSTCDDIKIFNQNEVSALDIVKKDVPMYVNDVLLYPDSE